MAFIGISTAHGHAIWPNKSSEKYSVFQTLIDFNDTPTQKNPRPTLPTKAAHIQIRAQEEPMANRIESDYQTSDEGKLMKKNPAAVALGRMTSAKKKASSTANALKASKAASLARASLKEKK